MLPVTDLFGLDSNEMESQAQGGHLNRFVNGKGRSKTRLEEGVVGGARNKSSSRVLAFVRI